MNPDIADWSDDLVGLLRDLLQAAGVQDVTAANMLPSSENTRMAA